MKAFVIKNKEGKYLAVSSGDYEHYWTTIDFAHYFRFLNGTHNAKREAEEFRDRRYPDCEVVEITITEGDLEQQLAEKDKEINKLKQSKKYVYNCLSFVSNSDVTDVAKYIEDLHQTIAQNNEELDE